MEGVYQSVAGLIGKMGGAQILNAVACQHKEYSETLQHIHI